MLLLIAIIILFASKHAVSDFENLLDIPQPFKTAIDFLFVNVVNLNLIKFVELVIYMELITIWSFTY